MPAAGAGVDVEAPPVDHRFGVTHEEAVSASPSLSHPRRRW